MFEKKTGNKLVKAQLIPLNICIAPKYGADGFCAILRACHTSFPSSAGPVLL